MAAKPLPSKTENIPSMNYNNNPPIFASGSVLTSQYDPNETLVLFYQSNRASNIFNIHPDLNVEN